MPSVHAQPQVAVGGVVFHEEQVLLVRRRMPPLQGLWAIPGGHIHPGERAKHAVAREILEETGIVVAVTDEVHVIDLIDQDEHGHVRFHYVILDWIATYQSGNLSAGDDAQDVVWAAPEDLERMSVTDSTLMLLRRLGFLS